MQGPTHPKWIVGDGASFIVKNTFIAPAPVDGWEGTMIRQRSEPGVLASITRDMNFSAMLQKCRAKSADEYSFHLPCSDELSTYVESNPEELIGEVVRTWSGDCTQRSEVMEDSGDEFIPTLTGDRTPSCKRSVNRTSQKRSSSANSGRFSHGSIGSGLSGISTMSTMSCMSGAGALLFDPSPLPEDDATNTTVVVKNLPESYTREMLISFLDGAGFKAKFNFMYLPVDFGSLKSFGYAVINFVSHADALCFGYFFHGYKGLADDSTGFKIGEVEWSTSLQGLEKHVERYRDSPLMHSRVRDELKPMLFVGGERVVFPPPTKALKIPRRANRKSDRNSYLASPGNLISGAVGLAMTYTPLNQSAWPKPCLPDAATRAVRTIVGVTSAGRANAPR